ncbi:MAG: hypothetical protein CUN57_00285, partial [Phototrophicales bacterium]
DDLDVEIVVPIGDVDITELQLNEKRVMNVCTIEGHDTVATVIEHGNKETWDGSYLALSEWMKQHDYEPMLPTREVYLTDKGDTNDWLVEIQYPVKKVTTANA